MPGFAERMKRYAQATSAQALEQAKRLASAAATEVVAATPVRSGRARGNWTGGIGRAPTGTRYRPPAQGRGDRGAGEAALARIEAAIESAKPGADIVLANSTPYILDLEHGGSHQAPAGMVKLAVRKLGG